MSKTKVIVAMSGGVDSSVAAALLKERGYDVYGVTLRLSNWESTEGRTFGGCCGSSDFYDARSVAQTLGIPHYSFDYVEKFRQSVIGYFKDSYLQGETPNPCIACNQFVKFDYLLKQAVALGADYVATGHYARIEDSAEGRVLSAEHATQNSALGTQHYQLKRAVDPSKDQSYVLYHLGQAELSKLMFPLGGLKKSEVRDIARRYNLRTADKPDSQEICFVPNQDYRQFIREEVAADHRRPGPIRHRDGRVLGEHKGLPFYTIGQREGLGIAVGHPLYVTAIETGSNTLVVGEKSDVQQCSVQVREVSWVSGAPPEMPCRAQVKIRYRHEAAFASLVASERRSAGASEVASGVCSEAPMPRGSDAHNLQIRFEGPQSAPTPGQAAVFYDGDVVLGGGVIDRVG